MGTVATAEPAILAQLKPIRRLLLIFLRIVIAALALGARHYDHYAILFFRHLSAYHEHKENGLPVRSATEE